MTLKEALEIMEHLHIKLGPWAVPYSDALRVVIDAAREKRDDTAEIVPLTVAKS